ncbi:DSBA-like thioredoxin domain protein [compost metagenome]
MTQLIPMKFTLMIIILAGALSCQSQTTKTMKENQNNPLLCDPITGTCELPDAGTQDSSQFIMLNQKKPVKIIYYTDPICSSCWGIEPQLRKLKLEYGEYIEIDYRMGGLLPDWSYNSGGISKPSDVAHHWEEVSAYYEMPIDGGVWLEDPLSSSYPPSIAVKAAQMQDKEKAIAFMRKLREYVFLEKKNITKWEVISAAAKAVGLNVGQLKKDYEDGDAKKLFEEDLAYGRQLGVRGFPSMYFSDSTDKHFLVYGFKPYETFEDAIKQLVPEAKKKTINTSTPLALFEHYPTLTAKEYSVLYSISVKEAQKTLEALVSENKLTKLVIKTGTLYQKK